MSVPPELEVLVGQLWQRKFANVPSAFESTEFRWLVKFCRDRYCGPGVPSEVASKEKFDADLQRHELERFFKFVGAPWHGGRCLDAKSVALSIHTGYTMESTETFTLLPLDLSDGIAPIEFGPWQIREFSTREFEEFIGIESLKRFGPAFVPDVERLHRLSWLVLRRVKKPWFQRNATIFDFDLSKVGLVDPSPREFDVEVERGLFVLALYPWEEYFSDQSSPWQPFRVPWTYTISRHVFGFPPRAPDPDVLNWTLAGNPDEDPFDVPAVLNYFEEKNRPSLQEFVSKWWELVKRVAPLGKEALTGFNPRIEHFFMRGFHERRIDQLLWHVTAIDAAVGKGSANAASTLARRIFALTKNSKLSEEFKKVHYRRRSELIHGKDLGDTDLWESDLAAVRRVARTVIVTLMEFVDAHPTWSRDEVIGFLDSRRADVA